MLASPFLTSVDAYVRERGSQGLATQHRAWALPLEPLGSPSEPGGSLKPRVDLALRSLFWLPAAFEHRATVRYPGGVDSGKEDGRTCDPGRRHNRPSLFIATYQYDLMLRPKARVSPSDPKVDWDLRGSFPGKRSTLLLDSVTR